MENIVPDVYKVLDEGVGSLTPSHFEKMMDGLREVLEKQLLKEHRDREPNAIRLSNMGKPCTRALWYDHRGYEGEELPPWVRMKFLYGDIVEQLLLYLVRESGHDVTDEQKRVELSGVQGSIDCKIDGVVCDVKSASTYSFKKFKDGTLAKDDPFGYIRQISAYTHAEGGDEGCFLALDKQHGHLALLPVTVEDNVERNLEYVKSEILADEPPENQYMPVPDGKSGNMKLATVCSYCKFKKQCYPHVRTFLYSNGPRFLTTVARQPDVPEVV